MGGVEIVACTSMLRGSGCGLVLLWIEGKVDES